jgi:hypothetical protein
MHISNFRPVKRVRDVVRTFAQGAAQRPCTLVMVATVPDRGAAEDEARELGCRATSEVPRQDRRRGPAARRRRHLRLPVRDRELRTERPRGARQRCAGHRGSAWAACPMWCATDHRRPCSRSAMSTAWPRPRWRISSRTRGRGLSAAAAADARERSRRRMSWRDTKSSMRRRSRTSAKDVRRLPFRACRNPPSGRPSSSAPFRG